MQVRIPLYKTQNQVGDEVIPGIQEVLRSGWLTMGPKTREFESRFAGYCGVKHAVATSNCTTALYLAYEALGVGPGDKVVVPVMTFSATANAVRWRGAEPVFCDVDEDGNMDPKALEKVLERERGVKAVAPVHLYGLPADMDPILRLARENGAAVVEDVAHSPGARYKGRMTGSLGDAGCFSFYATKNLSTGEGGMLTTPRDDVAADATKARSHRQNKDPAQKMSTWGYDVEGLGYNFRMSDFTAAIGISQLERLDALNKSRQEVAALYRERLGKTPGLVLPRAHAGRDHVYHLHVVRFADGPQARDAAFTRLQEEGILAGVHYPPLHLLSYYRQTTAYKPGDFPMAERLFGEILSLPMYPHMRPDEVDLVTGTLAATLP